METRLRLERLGRAAPRLVCSPSSPDRELSSLRASEESADRRKVARELPLPPSRRRGNEAGVTLVSVTAERGTRSAAEAAVSKAPESTSPTRPKRSVAVSTAAPPPAGTTSWEVGLARSVKTSMQNRQRSAREILGRWCAECVAGLGKPAERARAEAASRRTPATAARGLEGEGAGLGERWWSGRADEAASREPPLVQIERAEASTSAVMV